MNDIEKTIAEVNITHKIWHSLHSYLKKWYYRKVPGIKNDFTSSKRLYREVDFKEVVGYRAMQRMRKFVARNPQVIEISCDDDHHSSSAIYLIPHESKQNYMGTTMFFVPQNSPDSNLAFLYPNNLDKLIKELQKLQRRHRVRQGKKI